MKIAILTTFQEFNPGYSLTGIVSDQAEMLRKYGHDVTVYVCEQFNPKNPLKTVGDQFGWPEVKIEQKIPFGHLKDWQSQANLDDGARQLAEKTKQFLINECQEYDFIFTHDFVFVGWYLPYALGVRAAAPHMKRPRWAHWIHSVPSAMRDWWNIRQYQGPHKLVFPNKANQINVAENFRGELKDVVVIPHIKDARTWWEFGDDTYEILNAHPTIMHSDVLCVYPASSDRLSSKRVDVVMEIIAHIKGQFNQIKVAFVCANQWATGRQRKEDLQTFYRKANSLGLDKNEFIFTSEVDKKFELGLSKRTLRELFLLSNLFIFPTREESFGLVVPEAALSGAYCVYNRSLSMQMEITGMNGIYFHFGSFEHDFNPPDEHAYYKDVAKIILGRMKRNETIQTKTYMRKRYNYDYLYTQYYEPMLHEGVTWA